MYPVRVCVLAEGEALRVGLVASLRETHGIEIVGEHALKAFEDPVRVWEVRWSA